MVAAPLAPATYPTAAGLPLPLPAINTPPLGLPPVTAIAAASVSAGVPTGAAAGAAAGASALAGTSAEVSAGASSGGPGGAPAEAPVGTSGVVAMSIIDSSSNSGPGSNTLVDPVNPVPPVQQPVQQPVQAVHPGNGGGGGVGGAGGVGGVDSGHHGPRLSPPAVVLSQHHLLSQVGVLAV